MFGTLLTSVLRLQVIWGDFSCVKAARSDQLTLQCISVHLSVFIYI